MAYIGELETNKGRTFRVLIENNRQQRRLDKWIKDNEKNSNEIFTRVECVVNGVHSMTELEAITLNPKRGGHNMTKVHFKKHSDGDIIAFFPDTIQNGELLSYQHIGQHGDAEIEFYNELPDATPEEYAPLLTELVVLVGYDDLEVVVRSEFLEKQFDEVVEVDTNTYDVYLENYFTTDEKEYIAIENLMDSLFINTDSYSINASYDVSGFNYWVRDQVECNYCVVVVMIKEGISELDKENIVTKIEGLRSSLLDFDGVRNAYSNREEVGA